MDDSIGIKVLKLSAEYLGIVNDWKKVRYYLLSDVIDDLYRKDICDFGYRQFPDQDAEVSAPVLKGHIDEIVFELDQDPGFSQTLDLSDGLKKLFDAYTKTDSFKIIMKKYEHSVCMKPLILN